MCPGFQLYCDPRDGAKQMRFAFWRPRRSTQAAERLKKCARRDAESTRAPLMDRNSFRSIINACCCHGHALRNFFRRSAVLRRASRSACRTRSALFRPIARIAVEAGTRDTRYANVLHKVFCERHVVRKSEASDVGHHVIGPARHENSGKPASSGRALSDRAEHYTLPQAFGSTSRQTKRCCPGLLQRSRRSHSQKVMNFANCVGDFTLDPTAYLTRHPVTL